MREEFEKLPEIAEHLHNVVFDVGSDEYQPKNMGYIIHEFSAYFINGAYYAFKEKQKTIVKYEAGLRKNKANKHKLLAKNIELQKKIDAVLHCIAQSELHQDRAIWGLQDEIKELLK